MTTTSFDRDAFNDVNRWVKNAKEEIHNLIHVKIKFAEIKQNLSQFETDKYNSMVSEHRSFLIMVRKGIEWFYNRYQYHTDVTEKFLKECERQYQFNQQRISETSKKIKKESNLDLVQELKNEKDECSIKLLAYEPFISTKNRYKHSYIVYED